MTFHKLHDTKNTRGPVKDLDIAIRKSVAAVGASDEHTCRVNYANERIQEVNFMPETPRKWVSLRLSWVSSYRPC